MVRECSPPEREPTRSSLARRSTMATSTPANANSPANISPVGPPPATTTACSAIRHPHPRRFWFQPQTLQHDPGLAASPPERCMLRVAVFLVGGAGGRPPPPPTSPAGPLPPPLPLR